jgi:hypothetical protein
MHLMRRADFFVQFAVNSVSDPQFLIIRFDMNIAGVFSHSVVEQIVNQLNNRRLAGYLRKITYILCDIFYKRKIIESFVINNIIDDKNVSLR